ncbi:MAG: histidine phosphatase family protein [Acidimicrobiia bacterium]|nr:histidine phosphatase family protein [Acidimicrobiia bacterium]
MKLYLVRHAHAGVRSSADRHDKYRQLSDRGRKAADVIAASLADIDVKAVVSSPSTRCVQTVEPLAANLGLDVIEDERLWEDASIDAAIEVLMEHRHKGAVLCSHGNIIPDMLYWLIQEGLKTKGRGCAKGSVWTIVHKEGTFTKARYSSLDDLPH